MKRRAFLGFMGGAAAAGPKLAADIAAQGQPLGFGGSIVGASKDSVPLGGWRTERIAALKKLIVGGDPDAVERRKMSRLYSMEQQERYRLDTLRSVSLQHKFSMLMDGAERRQSKIDQSGWEYELRKLLSAN